MKKFGIVLLVIVLVIAAFLGGTFLGKTLFKPKGAEENTTVVDKVININLDEVVTELSNETEKISGKTMMFRFPKITLSDSDFAKEINDEITELKGKADIARKKIVEVGADIDQYTRDLNYDFSYFEENGILTIIVSHGAGDNEDKYNGKFYKVYNIDLATGKEVTKEELFKKAGENIDEFTTKMTEYAKKYTDPTSPNKSISYMRGKSLEVDNCEFYIKDGKLIALVHGEGTDFGSTFRIDMTNGESID